MEHQRDMTLADFAHGKNDMDMATLLLETSKHPEPAKTDFKAHSEWLNLQKTFRDRLREAHKSAKLSKGLGSTDNFVNDKTGKSQQEWRWHDATWHPTSVPAAVREVEESEIDRIEREIVG
jgi:hypothetical protein